MQKNPRRESFTVFEFVIALTILSILIAVVGNFTKVTEIQKNLRDVQRVVSVSNIEKNIKQIIAEEVNSKSDLFQKYPNLKPNYIYLSLPMNSATTNCKVDYPNLPDLSGYYYFCAPSSTYTNIDGSGWIPMDFSKSSISFSKLPKDPINNVNYFYAFTINSNYDFEIVANLESSNNKGPNKTSAKDGGDDDFLYEAGTNLTLMPEDLQEEISRGPSICYFKVWGISDFDEPRGLVYLNDGNYLIAETQGATVLPRDIILLKVTPSGNLIFSKKLVNSIDSNDIIRNMKTLSDGNILAVGFTNIYGNNDILVIKFNNNGDILWQRVYGGNSNDEGKDFIELSNGNIMIVGSTYSYGAGDSDGFILVIDKNGNILNFKTYGTPDPEIFNSVDKKDNEILITGTIGPEIGQRILVFKMDENLNIKFAKKYAGPLWWNIGYKGKFNNLGEMIIAGTTENPWNRKIWLMKLDNLGNVLWSKSILYNASESYPYDVYVSSNNNILVAGISLGAGYIARLDNEGNVLWVKKFERPYSESSFVRVLQSNNNPGYIILGYGRACIGGYPDIWFVKTDKKGNIKINPGSCAVNYDIDPGSNIISPVTPSTISWNVNSYSSINTATTNFNIVPTSLTELTIGSSCE